MIITSSHRLRNGVTVLTRQLPGAKTAAIALLVQGGVRAQRSGEAGFAHVLEHMLMDSPGPPGAISTADLFARAGGVVNAYTGREYLTLTGHVPAVDGLALCARFAHMLVDASVHADVLQRLQQHLALEQLNAWRRMDDGEEAAVLATVWPGHPLGGAWFPSGCVIDGSQLDAFRRRLCVGGGVAVLAAGAVEHAAVVEAVDLLARLPAGDAGDGGSAPVFRDGARAHLPGSAGVTRMQWVLPVDPCATANAELFGHALAGTMAGSLQHLLHDRLALAYEVWATHMRYRDGGLLCFGFETAGSHAIEAARATDVFLCTLANEGLTDADHQAAKLSLQARRQVDNAHPEHHLEELARLLHAGDHENTSDTDTDTVNEWFRSVWPRHALLTWGA